jgi:type I restriction enzyme R subunit
VSLNEADARYHLIDPVLRDKGYVSRERITLETVLTPPPVEPTGPKGRRRGSPGRTDYLLCVQVGDMPRAMPVAVLEAKRESDDPLRGMQQARGYADTLRFDVKYVFSTNGHRYGEYDRFTQLIEGPFAFNDFPAHVDLTTRYANASGIDLTRPEATVLFQADSPAWSQTGVRIHADPGRSRHRTAQCRGVLPLSSVVNQVLPDGRARGSHPRRIR